MKTADPQVKGHQSRKIAMFCCLAGCLGNKQGCMLVGYWIWASDISGRHYQRSSYYRHCGPPGDLGSVPGVDIAMAVCQDYYDTVIFSGIIRTVKFRLLYDTYIYIHVFFWQPKFYTLLSEYQCSRKWQSAQTLIVWSPCPLWLFSNSLSWWYLIATMTNWVYTFWTKDLRFLQLGEFWFYNGSPPRMFLPLGFLLDY